MPGPEPADHSHVTLLVPHPERPAVLVADEGGAREPLALPARPRLPSLQVPAAEPLLSEVLASVAAMDVVNTDRTAVLRQVLTSPEDTEVTLVVEFEAGPPTAPPGWVWLDLDPGVVEALEPESCRSVLASWVVERAEGWSPARPAWSRPGWLPRASAWMVHQLSDVGRPATDAPRPHQLWGLSVVLRAASAGGDAYFKCSTEVFRHEAVLTQALARLMPDRVPEVIAVDSTEGWLLMHDLGAHELGEQDETTWHHGPVALAAVQQTWLGRVDELVRIGVPVRSLTELADQVQSWTADTDLLGRMTPDLRERWLADGPRLVQACRRLDQVGPGPSLVHGDFHPWNVTWGAGGARIFDWSDAAVSHPFVDLATYVFRTTDVSVRRLLVDAYVAAWSSEVSEDALREAVSLALVVGALYQVQTYRVLLPTLMGGGGDDGLAGADLAWVRHALDRHRHGLESPG